ncbi:MAG: hypothetical protein JWN48_2333 [Myxococcaceae bacterium]|nr:hypothetical protein [Myxococcaceae bacterium]
MGGLDAGAAGADGAVQRLDGGEVRREPDGALSTVADATSTTVCAPSEQVLPVSQPAYHREGPIDYPDPPPVGGDHNPCWGKWGVYSPDRPLEVEHWVHNLEHGGVVYLYNCADGCADEVAQLAKFVKGRQQALLTPYAGLTTRFAVVAWGVRITSDCFAQDAFEGFYRQHVNMGSEKITSDPPASCL